MPLKYQDVLDIGDVESKVTHILEQVGRIWATVERVNQYRAVTGSDDIASHFFSADEVEVVKDLKWRVRHLAHRRRRALSLSNPKPTDETQKG